MHKLNYCLLNCPAALIACDGAILLHLDTDSTIADYLSEYENHTGEPAKSSSIFHMLTPDEKRSYEGSDTELNLFDVIFALSGKRDDIAGYSDCSWADFPVRSVCGLECIAIATAAAKLEADNTDESTTNILWFSVIDKIKTICLG